MLADSIAQALRVGQNTAPVPPPPTKKPRVQEEQHLSDDEEDFFPEGTATEDISQADPPPIQTQAADSRPDNTALVQLSQTLQNYLASTVTDREPLIPPTGASRDSPPAGGPLQQAMPPPLGQAPTLAQKWDDIAVVPFKVQPEHSALRGKKSRTALSNTAAAAFMQAAGVSPDDSDDFLRKAQAVKSGENRSCIDLVVHEVSWPHEKVRRLMGVHAGYKDLSFPELMAGSLTVLAQSLPNSSLYNTIRGQLDYFANLALDANENPWHLVRASHKEILISLEQGLLSHTAPREWKLLRHDTLLRLKNSPSANNAANNSNTPRADKPQQGKNKGKISLQVCKNYNLGTCAETDDHVKGNIKWTHICSHCFGKSGAKNSHAVLSCDAKRNEAKAPKNEKGGAK